MSDSNVEIVRRGVEAFSRADWEESVELMDPDIEWHDAPDLVPVSRELAQVVTVRDGRATKIVGYDDRVEALEAAGLPPEAGNT